jgi:hypothetical protein
MIFLFAIVIGHAGIFMGCRGIGAGLFVHRLLVSGAVRSVESTLFQSRQESSIAPEMQFYVFIIILSICGLSKIFGLNERGILRLSDRSKENLEEHALPDRDQRTPAERSALLLNISRHHVHPGSMPFTTCALIYFRMTSWSSGVISTKYNPIPGVP